MLVFAIVVSTGYGQTESQGPRSIVLLIGDGMGVAHVTAGRTVKGSLALESFPVGGLMATQPAGVDYVTDSGAGATALSTGVKTSNGAIAVDTSGGRLETVFERARLQGKKTGVVVVCSVTHATPAAFMSHVASRGDQLEIAEQIAGADVDVILGGGWGWFLPKQDGGRRTDGRNLLGQMEERGYVCVQSESDFTRLMPDPAKQYLGLFAENHPGPAQERVPSLADMTKFALEVLESAPKGFVMMIEGSQIDWAAHDNKSDQIAAEMVDFDSAIGIVADFARKHPETLVIVTADHETGGYTLPDGSVQEKCVKGAFTTRGHTGVMVPIFAMGRGAERFGGIHENAAIGKTILSLLEN